MTSPHQLAADVGSGLPERRLKVCLASMGSFIGGAEVAAERLACGLRDTGHDVFLLLGNRGSVMERMKRSGLRCIHAPMYFTDKWHWWQYWQARSAIRRHLKQEWPDVLHSNDLTTHQIMSDAARRLGIPRICHHRFRYDAPFTDWLNKYGAEHHLFVSRALREEICSGRTQWEHASCAVVYDGLPLPSDPTHKDRLRARAELGLSSDRIVVTFAGQIIPRKGVADLLRSWAALDSSVRDRAELLIIGDDLDGRGDYRAKMESLARELGHPVRFAGFQNNVGHWLLASNLAVVPSHHEPLGNATLEAMAYALPVIGCAVGGIPEMVLHGQTGVLVPPADPRSLAAALADLISDPPRRAAYGSAGRRRCADLFSLRAHTQAILREYRHVLRCHEPNSVA